MRSDRGGDKRVTGNATAGKKPVLPADDLQALVEFFRVLDQLDRDAASSEDAPERRTGELTATRA